MVLRADPPVQRGKLTREDHSGQSCRTDQTTAAASSDGDAVKRASGERPQEVPIALHRSAFRPHGITRAAIYVFSMVGLENGRQYGHISCSLTTTRSASTHPARSRRRSYSGYRPGGWQVTLAGSKVHGNEGKNAKSIVAVLDKTLPDPGDVQQLTSASAR